MIRYKNNLSLVLFFTLFLVIFPEVFFSQNQSIVVDYNAFCGDDELLKNIGKEEFDKYKNEIEQQKFKLIATKQQSYFFTSDGILNSPPLLKIHTSLDTNKSLKELTDSKLLIELPRTIAWQLTTDSKVIQGYTCYKAHSSYSVVRGDRTFTFPIIAWFTPEIPYPFGPKGYFGLPGLILELQERNITYGVSKMTFDNSSAQKIPNIPKYKSMTEGEWEAQALKRMMEE